MPYDSETGEFFFQMGIETMKLWKEHWDQEFARQELEKSEEEIEKCKDPYYFYCNYINKTVPRMTREQFEIERKKILEMRNRPPWKSRKNFREEYPLTPKEYFTPAKKKKNEQ